MKVKIGPHGKRISFYNYDWPEKYLGESRYEKLCDKVQPLLDNTINRVLDRDQKVKVHIDNYDVWNADYTLALIIAPTLRKLKETTQSSAFVDNEDVPLELRAYPQSQADIDQGKVDDNHSKRWEWVLDEMIWAFEQSANPNWDDQYHSGNIDIVSVPLDPNDPNSMYSIEKGPNDTSKFDKEGYTKHLERIKNGHRLFGKYYMALWS